MSTTAPTRPGTGRPQRTTAIATAFVLLLLHNVDEAFVHPEDGGRVSVVGTMVLGLLVVVAYSRLGRRWRIGLTAVLGVLATLQALMGHVLHLVAGNAAPLDWSGLFYLAGGLTLVGVMVAELRSPAEAAPAN